MNFNLNAIDNALLLLALKEDLNEPACDVTTDLLFKNTDPRLSAHIISKHPTPSLFCGEAIAHTLLRHFDNDAHIEQHIRDGESMAPGSTVLTCTAKASALLKVERTLLNFLRHLSAISTHTAQFVAALKDLPTKILDTRKTMPGLRHLEKYAVFCGGGVNHRMGLFDAYMIKDTHADLVGGLDKALAALPLKQHNPLAVIVEVRDQTELDLVLNKGLEKVTRVLLDNMTLAELRLSVEKCRHKIETEASGNISLENIRAIAETGVDFASSGRLTYGAGQIDLAMKI